MTAGILRHETIIPTRDGFFLYVRSWLSADEELSWGYNCGPVDQISEEMAWDVVEGGAVRARADDALLKDWPLSKVSQ
jgi:hypothetical protein